MNTFLWPKYVNLMELKIPYFALTTKCTCVEVVKVKSRLVYYTKKVDLGHSYMSV